MLHVTNGDIAAAKVAASVGGEVLPWRDVLHDGPVPAVGPDELRRVRARHIGSRGWEDEAAARAGMEARDSALLGSERVALWFEHDLYDQLQLLQILWMRGHEGVEAIVVDRYLGDLSVEEVGALWPERTAVSAEEAEAAREAWAAFTGDDPSAWTEVGGSGPLRHVPAAFHRLAEELPWTADGKTRSERQWEEAGGDFERSQRSEEARFMSDAVAALPPSKHLGGVERARWRWDAERGVASPA